MTRTLTISEGETIIATHDLDQDAQSALEIWATRAPDLPTNIGGVRFPIEDMPTARAKVEAIRDSLRTIGDDLPEPADDSGEADAKKPAGGKKK